MIRFILLRLTRFSHENNHKERDREILVRLLSLLHTLPMSAIACPNITSF